MSENTIANILDLYRSHGREHYGDQSYTDQNSGEQSYGEEVSQLEHAFQCVELARADGQDDMMLAAAFLHDIGHLLEFRDRKIMGGYNAMAHDKRGAEYLASAGFPERVVSLVASHVQAKRYLCAIEPGYHDQLSGTSRRTLQWQGGPMSMDEVSDFSTRSDLDEVLTLRRYDEQAKEINQRPGDLLQIEELLTRVLALQVAVA